MPSSNLINHLRQKIKILYAPYQYIDLNQKILTNFDRTLFSQDRQPFQFYLNEIEQTLQQIALLQPEQLKQADFLTEKLFTQCNVLKNALDIQKHKSKTAQTKSIKSKANQQTTNKKATTKNDVHKLPPRQRLVKYYEALQALNDKLNGQEYQLQQINSEIQKQQTLVQIAITQQRKKRCLDAIELLEEYLISQTENQQT